MTPDLVIGDAGGLPWRISEDLQHFKKLTLGHAIIMGRKTYDSIGRALPRRRNIVVSRNPSWHADDCEHAMSVPAAIALARESDPCPMIIGGAKVYEAALPLVTRMFITEVQRSVSGDTHFPAYERTEFEEVRRERASEHEDVVFVELARRAGSAP
jgi:dihydrofolate reductase